MYSAVGDVLRLNIMQPERQVFDKNTVSSNKPVLSLFPENHSINLAVRYNSCTRFGGTYIKIGTIQRRLAWPLRKSWGINFATMGQKGEKKGGKRRWARSTRRHFATVFGAI